MTKLWKLKKIRYHFEYLLCNGNRCTFMLWNAKDFSILSDLFINTSNKTKLFFLFVGDLIGMLLALISLMPFAVIAGFITLIIFRRDLHTVRFFYCWIYYCC